MVERWQQQGGNPRVVFDAALGFREAVEKTNSRLGVMPQEVLRRIYLKTGSLQLEEKGDKDPNSAVVTLRPELAPLQRPDRDHGLPCQRCETAGVRRLCRRRCRLGHSVPQPDRTGGERPAACP